MLFGKGKRQITYNTHKNPRKTKKPHMLKEKRTEHLASNHLKQDCRRLHNPRDQTRSHMATAISRKEATAATEEKNKHTNHEQPHHANCKKWGIN
jgi:hypothetical protein